MKYYLFYPSYCKSLGRPQVTGILLRGVYIRCHISGEFGKVYQNLENMKGTRVAQSVKCLPLAQVMIPESWDQALTWAPCPVGILLLLLPL